MIRILMPVYSSAYQVITLSAMGDAETPAGGSVCMRCQGSCVSPGLKQRYSTDRIYSTLKSRIRRRRADVDIIAPWYSLWTVRFESSNF